MKKMANEESAVCDRNNFLCFVVLNPSTATTILALSFAFVAKVWYAVPPKAGKAPLVAQRRGPACMLIFMLGGLRLPVYQENGTVHFLPITRFCRFSDLLGIHYDDFARFIESYLSMYAYSIQNPTSSRAPGSVL